MKRKQRAPGDTYDIENWVSMFHKITPNTFEDGKDVGWGVVGKSTTAEGTAIVLATEFCRSGWSWYVGFVITDDSIGFIRMQTEKVES